MVYVGRFDEKKNFYMNYRDRGDYVLFRLPMHNSESIINN